MGALKKNLVSFKVKKCSLVSQRATYKIDHLRFLPILTVRAAYLAQLRVSFGFFFEFLLLVSQPLCADSDRERTLTAEPERALDLIGLVSDLQRATSARLKRGGSGSTLILRGTEGRGLFLLDLTVICGIGTPITNTTIIC